jgi:hypothetical protein
MSLASHHGEMQRLSYAGMTVAGRRSCDNSLRLPHKDIDALLKGLNKVLGWTMDLRQAVEQARKRPACRPHAAATILGRLTALRFI